jgi:hypothetical protein
MKWAQLKYLTAMMLIGDGVLAMLRPYRDAMTWDIGPKSWRAMMHYLSDHPDTLRAIGAAEVALGFALIASDGSAAEQLAEKEAAARARVQNIA